MSSYPYRFYTTSVSERQRAASAGYVAEGITCLVLSGGVPGVPDAVPVYRFLLGGYDHFYTTNAREAAGLMLSSPSSNVFQGIGFYVYTQAGNDGRVGFYRAAHGPGPGTGSPPPLPAGDHLYSSSQLDMMSSSYGGYLLEDPIGLVLSTSSATPPSQQVTQLYRTYNSASGDHFYTTSQTEWQNLIPPAPYNQPYHLESGVTYTGLPNPYGGAANWSETVPYLYVPTAAPDRLPLYGVFGEADLLAPGTSNMTAEANFLTTDLNECATLLQSGGRYFRGVVAHVYKPPPAGVTQPDRQPLYCLQVEPIDDLRYYTIDANERSLMLANGAKDMGIVCYVPIAAGPDTAPLFQLRRQDRRRAVDKALGRTFQQRAPNIANVLLSGPPPSPADSRAMVSFSRLPQDNLLAAKQRGYGAALVERGVPLLERDLNLLGDLSAATMHQAVELHLGNGPIATGSYPGGGFAIGAAVDLSQISYPYAPSQGPSPQNDFSISAGSFLVGGVLLNNPTTMLYSAQTFTARVNDRVRISNGAAAYMEGAITSRSGATLVVNVDTVVGNGTYASWNIGVAGNAAPGSFAMSTTSLTLGMGSRTFTASAVPPLTIPAPPAPGDSNERIDVVYLDVWFDELAGDPNNGDVGFPTTTLVVPSWLVRVAEGGAIPPEPRGHRYQPLAAILRPRRGLQLGLITAEQIEDLRVRVRSLTEIQTKLGALASALTPTVSMVVNPTRGFANTYTGSALDIGNPVVTIGGIPVPARPSQVVGSVDITCPMTLPVGPQQMVVANGFGTSSSGIPVVVTAPPTITSILATAGGLAATIYGTSLDSTSSVTFTPTSPNVAPGGPLVTRNIVVVNAGQIQVFITSAGQLYSGSSYSVSLTNADTTAWPANFYVIGLTFS